jgi:hypothetical protein
MEIISINIDPVEGLFVTIPDGTFTEFVLNWQEMFNGEHG